MLSHIAPASHGDTIVNDYFLQIKIHYDACTCNHPTPEISLPMTIIPLTHQESYGFVEPAGYAPVMLGMFKFDLQKITSN